MIQLRYNLGYSHRTNILKTHGDRAENTE